MYLIAFSLFNWLFVKSIVKDKPEEYGTENPWLVVIALFLCLINFAWAVLLAITSFHIPSLRLAVPVRLVH